LLNVGPDARGRIPEESVTVLKDVGVWMADNSESIYGCGISEFSKPEWGRYTQKGNVLYAHIFDQSIGQICLEGLKGKVESVCLLSDNTEMFTGEFWHGERSYIDSTDLFLNFIEKPAQNTFILPDDKDTVVKLKLNK